MHTAACFRNGPITTQCEHIVTTIALPCISLPLRTRAGRWSQAHTIELATVTGSPVGPTTQVSLNAHRKGLSLRFHCEATRITASMKHDGDPLYLEDVVEVFLHPNSSHPGIYLEYEVSPIGTSTALLCCRNGENVSRWSPWGSSHKTAPRCTVTVQGGKQKNRARITSWQADIDIPWAACAGIAEVPQPGDTWNANFYRIDRATKKTTYQAWSNPQKINFHRLSHFGTILFTKE